MTEHQGTRREDIEIGDWPEDVQPGDYWRYVNRQGRPLKASLMYPRNDMSGNLTDEVWGVYTPNGLYGMLSLHTVREKADGTIDVRPGDGSSNSILVSLPGPEPKSYHGYIYAGVWKEC